MTYEEQLETVLRDAFTKAIQQVGMANFKATSMFASNQVAARKGVRAA